MAFALCFEWNAFEISDQPRREVFILTLAGRDSDANVALCESVGDADNLRLARFGDQATFGKCLGCREERLLRSGCSFLTRRGPRENWGVDGDKARRIKNLTDGSEKPVGEWNTMQIVCREREIEVRVNGTLVNHGTQCTASSGQIALQAEGVPVEFRKLLLTTNPH